MAVKWRFPPDSYYYNYATSLQFQGTAPLRIWVQEAADAERLYARIQQVDAWQFALRIGVLLMAGLMHLFLFLWFRQQRANLYYAVFALAVAAGGICVAVGWGSTENATVRFVTAMLDIEWTCVAAMAGLTTIYAIVNQPRGRAFWAIAGIFVCAVLLNPLVWWGAWFATYALAVPLYADAVRVSLRARRLGEHGATAIVWAMVVGMSFYGAATAVNVLSDQQHVLSIVLLNISFLTNPLIFSLLLGQKYAFTGRALALKLREVEALSARSLEQEQEKQALLASQNETLEREVGERTQELRQSLARLQTTQEQLIQAEKMASLGELTAGIAHEIQNPLNFVNNFAEVSTELLDELTEEQQRPAAEQDATLLAELTGDLRQNLEKIAHHGRRADGIVRGMLQHSRTTTGERTPTDLNALADEYLRLAYHGLRAKDKSFNALFSTDFDSAVGSPVVAGADVGRVLLNLFTNAFYAVRQRQQQAAVAGETGYQPTVSVQTRVRPEGGTEIRVQDNGTGISDAVKSKVFQPFFTTKPTGEGTGLGLSLAYDLITKGHGGTLTVESRAGEGTEFIIRLPAGRA